MHFRIILLCFLVLGLVPVLAGCMTERVSTTVSACRAHDPQPHFFVGVPEQGQEVSSKKDRWDFGADAGSVYLQCQGKEGGVVTQRLPAHMDFCLLRDESLYCYARL